MERPRARPRLSTAGGAGHTSGDSPSGRWRGAQPHAGRQAPAAAGSWTCIRGGLRGRWRWCRRRPVFSWCGTASCLVASCSCTRFGLAHDGGLERLCEASLWAAVVDAHWQARQHGQRRDGRGPRVAVAGDPAARRQRQVGRRRPLDLPPWGHPLLLLCGHAKRVVPLRFISELRLQAHDRIEGMFDT